MLFVTNEKTKTYQSLHFIFGMAQVIIIIEIKNLPKSSLFVVYIDDD
jgi:hypothetical protein